MKESSYCWVFSEIKWEKEEGVKEHGEEVTLVPRRDHKAQDTILKFKKIKKQRIWKVISKEITIVYFIHDRMHSCYRQLSELKTADQ